MAACTGNSQPKFKPIQDSQPKSSDLVLGRRPLGAVLHSSGELSQWLCHDDSTINIVLELLLFIIIAHLCSAVSTHSLQLLVQNTTDLRLQ